MYFTVLLLIALLYPNLLNAKPILSDPLAWLHTLSYEQVALKVQPSITYAILNYDSNGFKKGERVEVLEDGASGTVYRVHNTLIDTWVYADALTLLPPPLMVTSPLSTDELEFYMNHTQKTSITPYFLWVDLARQRLYVFSKPETKDTWIIMHNFLCATGKPTTPTARGTFTLLDRGELLDGKERVKYWVKFYKNYLFHSLPLSATDTVLDARLGEPISHGCVRLLEVDAKWLFDTIPEGTTVWVY